jgi:F0F1-type ATP synthase membrane subunit b/b'
MKQQDNHSPSKANSYTKDLNNSIEEETSIIEFQKTILSMINKLKEEIQKLVSDLKEHVNKELNRPKVNTNKLMNEIKKTMKDMKEEVNTEVENLKNNQSEINSSICHITISIKSLANRVEQFKNRVSGTVDNWYINQ